MTTGSSIRITLVEPQSSGNVGSVARAMKNTGFSRLVLVNPCEHLNNESYSMACKADDVLRSSEVVGSLAEAVEGAGAVVGFTRRLGRTRYPVLMLDEAVPAIIKLAAENDVSLLFGREDRGLTNDEIAMCGLLVEIPAVEEHGSINLSHAVFIVCHRLFMAQRPVEETIKAVDNAELERMFCHMEEALRSIGYGDKGGPELLYTILRSFRRLFGRTGLMQKEVNMLRGIFTQISIRAGGAPQDGGKKIDDCNKNKGAQ